MLLQIERHNRNLSDLQAGLDSIQQAVEEKTAEAREKLLTYQALKKRMEDALNEVTAGYEQAQSLYSQADALFEKLLEIKPEHDQLCRQALQIAETNPVAGEELLKKMQRVRRRLRKIYNAVKQMQRDHMANVNVIDSSLVGK